MAVDLPISPALSPDSAKVVETVFKKAMENECLTIDMLKVVYGIHRRTGLSNYLDLIRDLLLAYYKTPGGQRELQKAPTWLQEKTVEEVTDLVMKDVIAWDKREREKA